MNSTGRYIIGGIVLAIAFFLCWYFSAIISYILIAAVISFLGQPLVKLLAKIHIRKCKLPNALRAGIALLIIWSLFILFFVTVIPLVSNEFVSLKTLNVTKIVATLQGPLSDLGHYLKDYGLISNSMDLTNYLTGHLTSFLDFSKLSNVFGSLADTLSSIAVLLFSVTFIAFFFLKDSELFAEIIVTLFPSKYEDGIRKSLDSIQKLLGRYFVGIVIEIFGVMTLNTLGLTIVGLDFSNALVIGLATGILNVIPYIGPIIGMVLGLTIGTVLNLNMDFYSTLFPLLLYMEGVFLLTQLIDNVVFQPLIYGNSVYAHPLEIFLVILMAGSIAGIPGMILAIPSYTVIRVVLREFFSKYKLVKKITQSMQNEEDIHAAHHRGAPPVSPT